MTETRDKQRRDALLQADPDRKAGTSSPSLERQSDGKISLSAVSDAIRRTQEHLLACQDPEGYWVGELGADVSLVADYVTIMMYYLGRHDAVREEKAKRHILRRQLPEGGWNLFPGGPCELNATAKCYFALKLMGFSPDDPRMRKAREVVLDLGGLEKLISLHRFYLALFGQYDWKGIPAIPPEILLIPQQFFFNIYDISSWSRAIMVPLAVIYAKRPHRSLPPDKHIDELWANGKRLVDLKFRFNNGLVSWDRFFTYTNETLKLLELSPVKPLRKAAIEKARDWILERCSRGGGLGAVFPSMLNAIVALHSLGFGESDPEYVSAIEEFERLVVETEDDIRIQPCFSPIWDTAISCVALRDSGLDSTHPALQKATRWLVSKEIKVAGDWRFNNPEGKPGGWAFEFENEYYPDIDDTFMVVLALQRIAPDDPEVQAVVRRAIDWVITMQSDDGGWGAFDKNNNKDFLTQLPFADHNALIDPSTSDLAGRALEMFGYLGGKASDPVIQRAIRFLKKGQERDGSWYGRWGVNYIYGTWQAIRGLQAIGEDPSGQCIRAACDWLLSCQKEDGSWGESCASYDNPSLKGQGASTPSQTAWALMGLMHGGIHDHPAVRRGIRYLLESQKPDGTWDEDVYTGTGFPKVFYLEYPMYRVLFPLMAFAQYRDLS